MLKTLKVVLEVCRIFCATGNPTGVILTKTKHGHGILEVVHGLSPMGVGSRGKRGPLPNKRSYLSL